MQVVGGLWKLKIRQLAFFNKMHTFTLDFNPVTITLRNKGLMPDSLLLRTELFIWPHIAEKHNKAQSDKLLASELRSQS